MDEQACDVAPFFARTSTQNGFLRDALRFQTLVAVLLVISATSLAAQTVTIKLVDGRTGRPMTGTSAYVNVWVGTQRREAIGIPADDNGVAQLELTLDPNEVNVPISMGGGTIVEKHPVVQYAEAFQINAPFIFREAGKATLSPFERKSFITKEILDHGYASANTCGKATSQPLLGQIILFVRPLTFWEKMKE